MAEDLPATVPTEEIVCVEPVPDIFIDGYQGVLVRDGVARFNLTVDRMPPQGGAMKRVVVSRLVMSLPTMLRVHEALGQLIGELLKDGFLDKGEENKNA